MFKTDFLSPSQKGILFVALGAVCFSAKAIFIKLAYKNYDIDDITLLSMRFGFALPFYLAIACWRIQQGKLKNIEKRDWLWIAVLSLLGYYWASWFDFKGLQYISAGLERVILFVYPTFVVLFSRVFLNKKISKMAIYALVISYLGLFIIAFDPKIFIAKDAVLGASLILVSAVTYSLFLVFGGEMIQKYGSANFNTVSMIFSSVFVLLHFNGVSDKSLLNLPIGLYGYGLALAIISTLIPTFLMSEGIKILGASKSSIVASVGPVSTILLAFVFLNESLSLQEILGSLLIMFGVLLIGK